MQIIPKLISLETNFWPSSNNSFSCREILRNITKYYSLLFFLNKSLALNNFQSVKFKHQMDLDIVLKAVENDYDKDLHDEKIFSGIKYLLSVTPL